MNRVYKWYLRMHNSNYAFIRRFIEVMNPISDEFKVIRS